MRRLLIAFALAWALPACAAEKTPATDAKLWVSTEAIELQAAPVYAAEARRTDYEVFPLKADEPRRVVSGWGGAFNEKGWDVLQVLSPEEREAVLRRIFEPGKGMSLTMGRIPIGSSDYALSRYALDETEGDLGMEHFSIERDRKLLIPYVQAAQKVNPALRFWGSAWSPPPWMKDNGAFDSGKMKDDPKIYAAYALYLAKFVEAYRAEKIPVEAVAVQNEPYILTHYPSCKWDPAQYRAFVRDHLGPMLAERKSGAVVMLGTFNQPDNEAHARAVLEDEKARQYVGVLGLQWNAQPIARAARKLSPDLRIWQTETDCGNRWWEPGFDPDQPQNDFDYAAYTWRKVRDYVDLGAEVYTLWNIVLDETGKSIDEVKVWPQNSPIVVNRTTRQVTYTPMFKAFEHWSQFARPGAAVLRGSGSDNALAFSAGKQLVVELLNTSRSEKTVRVRYGDRAWDAVLPPKSFGTLVATLE
jgi:glucosylceramidase